VGDFGVDTDGLLAMLDSMSEFEQHLETHLAHVDATVRHLGNSWMGGAAEAARAAHAHWNQGAQHMRDALRVLRVMAEGAHANYSGAVQVNTGNWI
jgi:ESAT-6 family protein